MKNKKGSTIVWAVMLIMVLMVIVGASLSFAYMSYNQSIKNRNKTQVEMIANSAIKSLVSVIEDDKIKVPDDTTPKQIKSMELVNTYSNEKNTSYGSISDIYIKRKEENGRLALAYLTAHYADEDYTIYGYLVYTRNAWKCVQYDTDGNRNIDIKTSGSDNTGDNTGENTGDNTGGNTGGEPDTPETYSDVFEKMYSKMKLLMESYYNNGNNLSAFNNYYKQECEKNNVAYTPLYETDVSKLTDNWFMNDMYRKLYNDSKYEELPSDLYLKATSLNGGIQYNSSGKMYVHICIPNNSNGKFVLVASGQNESWGYTKAYIVYVNKKLYLSKNMSPLDISTTTYDQLLENLTNINEWQEIN